MFDKLCRKGWSSSVHRTETVTMMGHKRSVAASSIRSDQKQQSCFVRICLFWNEVAMRCRLEVTLMYGCGRICAHLSQVGGEV